MRELTDEQDLPLIPIRPDGLQIDEHIALQRGVWLFQRISWFVMLIVIGLALAGYTGNGGMMADRRVDGARGSVVAPVVFRRLAADRILVTFAEGGSPQSLTIGAGFFEAFDLENISPPPAETVLSADGQTLRFESVGPGPHRVTLAVRPFTFGSASFAITLNGDVTDWPAFVFP